MERTFALAGAISGCIAVLAGAFGSHALRQRLSTDMLSVFEIGVRYQMYHALALFAAAWAETRWPGTAAHLSGYFFIAGSVIFSGTLYLLALTETRWLGAVTPVGGVALIIGWISLGWAAWRGGA
jgi:uncharacterized membrane protein YgdD (TMEM256/DUF423 family)